MYATYEVDSALSDKKLHSILGKLNPDLRSAEEVDGKRRIREFYAMPPEDAYAILEAIAEINGFHHRLKKMEGDDNSVAGRGAGPADRGAAPGTGLPVRIFQMRHFRGSGAGILLPRE